jgi:NitT/TauT family transport system substrate-binding protein
MRRFTGLLLVALGLALFATGAGAADLPRIVVSVPGPRNISYLPIDLIGKIGADRAAGVSIHLLHTGGGGVALNHLVTRNTDFAVAGLPAAMSLRANGGDVVCIAPVNDRPMFVLMVRAGLRRQVHRIADLRGRVIGVNTGTRDSKTTSQQLLELLLASDGVTPDSVRIVPAGQSWEAQSSLLLTGAADAVMGDEPYASRLRADKKVFFLATLADPALTETVPGAGFLHAALETRSDVIDREPWKVKAMVAMLQATLHWMAEHSPEEIVAALGVRDPQERAALLAALRSYPAAYSRDGRFSTGQLRHTELFFEASGGGGAGGRRLALESMIDDRWAGRRP